VDGDGDGGLVKGEGFAVDASVLEANASRYHGKAPDELDWTDAQRQKRAVAEYLEAIDEEAQAHVKARDEGQSDDAGGSPQSKGQGRYGRKPPKVISPSDPRRRGQPRPTNACNSATASTT
jgi:hypothetical protein